MRGFSLLVVAMLTASIVGCTGTPAASTADAERSAVLEVVETAVASDVAQSVTLDIVLVSIRPPFAAVVAVPRTETGDAIDYSAVPKFAAAVEAGAFDEQALVLLKKSSDGWKVLEYELGSTDFPGQDWAKVHGAPQDIFEQ